MAKDAELVFGASSESIEQIKRDLKGIIDTVNTSGVTNLKFTIDTKSASAATNTVVNQFTKLKSTAKEYYGLRRQYESTDASYTQKRLTLEKQIGEANKRLNTLYGSLKLSKEQQLQYDNLIRQQTEKELVIRSKIADVSRIQNTNSSAKEEVSNYKNLLSLQTQRNSVASQLARTDSSNTATRTALIQQMQTAQNAYNDALSATGAFTQKSTLSAEQEDSILKAQVEHRNQIKILQGQIADKEVATVSASTKSVNQNSIADVTTSFNKLQDSILNTKTTGTTLENLRNAFQNLSAAKTTFDTAPTTANLDAYKAQKTILNGLLDSFSANQKATHASANELLQYKNALKQVEAEYNRYKANIQKNPKLNADYTDTISQIKSKIAGGASSFDDPTQVRDKVVSLSNTLTETGGKVETFTQKLKNLFGIHLTTALTMVGIHALVQGLNQVYDNVVKLDEAVVNLQVATGYSREQTQALISDYSKYAKELGATTTQVAEASDTWLRQGYSIEQSNALIKDSMMLSKLGQMDSADATNSLTSAMRGYQMSVQDVTGIVDRLVKVDMSAAVSSSFIATAMSETATSADLAGISMDQLIGYIATIGSTTQDSAESVGNSLKTMFARMGNIKQGLLEDPETGESLSGVESSLSGVGIKLRDSNSEFRNFGDVLNEVAGKWDSYSSVQKRALSVSFAGTRQQEKFLVLMQHYNEALGYTKESTEAAGTAIDKFSNTYLKSVEAAQDRATASFENLSNTVLNSDLVAGTFNTGSGILDFLTKIIDFGDGAIPKIALLVAGIAALTKVQTALNLSYTNSTGRHKMICLVNMPVNDLVATRNELVA